MAATVAKEKHAKMPHHLSRATANQDGWVESLTSLTESVAATQLLQDVVPPPVGLYQSCAGMHGTHLAAGMSEQAPRMCMQGTNGTHEALGSTADMSEEEQFEVKLSHAVKTLSAEVCARATHRLSCACHNAEYKPRSLGIG